MIKYPIENKVYKSIIKHCESLQGKTVINSEVLAKKLSSMVAVGLLSEQQRKIYNCLTEKPKDTNTISIEVKISSITVAKQLKEINRTTQLISFNTEHRKKLWYK